jgi:hypothetical protein
MLNRAALIDTPAQAFIDWALSLDDSGMAPDVDGEKTIYLVPGFGYDDEAEQVLKRVYMRVFEAELYAWHTIQAAWPKRRTLAMFREWFQVEMHSLVLDFGSGDIFDDD